MEKQDNPGNVDKKTRQGVPNFYLISILLLMFIMPLASVFLEHLIKKIPIDPALIAKWFIFWSIGIRLLVAGIKQVATPGFTASQIFRMKSTEGYVVIRELGFANISLGVTGILTLVNGEWRQPVALAGGLFYGLAGFQHVFKKPDSNNEVIALFTDLFMFCLMLLYLFLTLSL